MEHGWRQRRPLSLFTRFLLAQLLTVAGVVLVLGQLFYVDRNLTVARLIAERWAPALHQAVGLGESTTLRLADQREVMRITQLPPEATVVPQGIPRLDMLRETLRQNGLPVEQLAMQSGSPSSLLWLQIRRPGDPQAQWLGLREPLMEPGFPLRLLLALALGLALVVGISGWLARWLTRPLERLRQRMAEFRPGAFDVKPRSEAVETSASGLATNLTTLPTLTSGASAEMAAIETAWLSMAQRLARHERERALMLASVSHDLRGPLGRIRLAAELLPEQAGVAARREAIVRNVQVADRLIQSFLDHARAASLALDQPVDLRALALELLASQGERGRLVTAALPETALTLPRSNALLLERMLGNLLDNAFQHGSAPVVLRLTQRADLACLEVQDAGPGIAPTEREAVLQAFYRGDPARSAPGTGLGLAIVREGLERLGGHLEFELAPGRNVVRLCLPLA